MSSLKHSDQCLPPFASAVAGQHPSADIFSRDADLNQPRFNPTKPTQVLAINTSHLCNSRLRMTAQYWIDVLQWKNPLRSTAISLAWMVLCIFPNLWFIAPQIFVIFWIAVRRLSIKSNAARSADTPAQAGGKLGASRTAKRSMLSGAIDEAETTRNIEGYNNLVFVQDLVDNLLGGLVRAHNLLDSIDWSNSERMGQWIQLSLLGILAVYFINLAVPARVIVMAAGLLPLWYHTTLVQLLLALLPTKTFQVMAITAIGLDNNKKPSHSAVGDVDTDADSAVELSHSDDDSGPTQSNRITIDVFENQRWTNFKWTSRLGPNERASWSDRTGKIQQPSRSTIELPSDEWRWDGEWEMDCKWGECDQNGWQYSDHHWQCPSPTQLIVSLTRRKRWIRSMIRVDCPSSDLSFNSGSTSDDNSD
ncbi:integral peroxisomal membrane peroxin-domain-containing protein [Polychytrium aggregatum]|uniref:integral peroxisomal membrane peroxin-domain-containing protein n=1 Tax=Polychytrium aggregatum TaxID=110093 RepID=UPI0022FEB625|nr:integral peroxisomal membrane peroxin-domain-containing protein [Polychytrium aggregatum]KAI9204667.1 integral peroxisomal membrane peroxin-domain-containing protein [Polychytrium aggregatum]